jgi:diguanylate cyclase
MRYRRKNQEDPSLDMERFIQQIRNNATQKDFYLNVARTLLVFIKDFAVDQEEIDSERFLKQMDELSDVLAQDPDGKSAESLFERYKKAIPAFMERQKAYLRDREKELWDIIDLQRTAISALDSENRDYNRKVYEQSERIEAITMLDDIKGIKKRLAREVETIQEAVRRKQQQDKRQMDELARQIDILSLELKKAQAKGMTDDLTGAYNRGAFDGYLRKLVDQNTIKPLTFSLLMIDIDDFKRINDDYGHPIGDRVLVALVQKCRDMIREQDFLARYGGEEFAIILPGASLKNAQKKAERLRKAVAVTRYTPDKQETGTGISITISIGVSIFGQGDSVSSIIDRADRALYQAKKAGKNRVVSEADAIYGQANPESQKQLT